jgi:hypothetical protein
VCVGGNAECKAMLVFKKKPFLPHHARRVSGGYQKWHPTLQATYQGCLLLQFHNLCSSRNVRELVLNAPFSKNNNLSIIKEGLFVCLFVLFVT